MFTRFDGLPPLALLLSALSVSAAELRVMSFNLWHGGDAGKQPLAQSAAVIRAARADLVGFQESRGYEHHGIRPNHGRKLAELLGWYYFEQGSSPGIASRHLIVTSTPGRHGATVRLPSGQLVTHFNVHLMHAPYQPYQLLNIPYADAPFIKTADEAITAARQARGGEVAGLLAEVAPAVARGETIFLTGDFNEPSHLDWTQRATQAGRCPLPVAYPTTLAVMNAGLKDSFRTLFPDEVAKPGVTWSPLTLPSDPKDHHDRIDFVFFAGPTVQAKHCEIVGESAKFADLVVLPYPSDHRAVVATFQLP
jgi:endonuclease/exonuclease/phosphatase family metal-dependent hydrolase